MKICIFLRPGTNVRILVPQLLMVLFYQLIGLCRDAWTILKFLNFSLMFLIDMLLIKSIYGIGSCCIYMQTIVETDNQGSLHLRSSCHVMADHFWLFPSCLQLISGSFRSFQLILTFINYIFTSHMYTACIAFMIALNHYTLSSIRQHFIRNLHADSQNV